MRKLLISYTSAFAVLACLFAACTDEDFESGKIQSVDNRGVDVKIISTAVTASSSSEFLANSVDGGSTPVDIQLIPVVLNSKDVASHDIHVHMVPALDTLESYNDANGTDYVMPGDAGTPAFTLANNGVVTIPAGSSVGYLTINTTPDDYFGSTAYAYAYRIESVDEPGFIISGNHNFGIVAVIPKNVFDGLYALNIETTGWDAYGISDGLPGDYGNITLQTTGQFSDAMNNLVAGGTGLPGFTTDNATKTSFGATAPQFTFDASNKLVQVINLTPDDGRGRAFDINPAATADENVYDPATGNIVANFLFHQNGRPDCTVKMILTYLGPRP